LKASEIRGEASNGMLCSEREMELSDEHDGIIDLPTDAPVGAAFAAYAGLDDPIIEIAITPNRADCLGVRGVARDLAAAGHGTLKPLDTSAHEGGFDSPVTWRLDLDGAEHLCPLITGIAFRGVTNGPSPDWMARRLTAIGQRPISALVDITNYVMFDLGRPLHAYDMAKIHGNELVVRQARGGEPFAALNEKTYEMQPGMITIGDAEGVDDLAGVMGGERTGVSEATTDMFLEIAIFDPDLGGDNGPQAEPAIPMPAIALSAALIPKARSGPPAMLARIGHVDLWRRGIAAVSPGPGGRLAAQHLPGIGKVEALSGMDCRPAADHVILEALGFTVSAADGRV
jgi:phenylalanyl-tRNA synthetase beta chain